MLCSRAALSPTCSATRVILGTSSSRPISFGVGSLPIVVLAGLSIGAELALNSAATLEKFGSLSLIGQLVSIGMVTELGPIITGLMVAGRNASGIASELGVHGRDGAN